jgi:6-pyruvoyltetrahydropterin/6-carboxytetrahydropterin synthase
MTARRMTVIRKTRFSAAHFLRYEELSDEQNMKLLGKSSNPLAHGHNYEVDVQVAGPVALDTGMVVNLKDLKVILNEEVVEPLDFKNLNLEVDYFRDRFTTLEHLALYIWARLKPRLDAYRLELIGVKVAEAEDLYVEYFGGKDPVR